MHLWTWPSKPWQRVHIDFAGPFLDRMYLLTVDTHSKWPEVFEMTQTTTAKAISALQVLLHAPSSSVGPIALVSTWLNRPSKGESSKSGPYRSYIRTSTLANETPQLDIVPSQKFPPKTGMGPCSHYRTVGASDIHSHTTRWTMLEASSRSPEGPWKSKFH